MRKPAPASPDNKTSVDLLIEQRKRQAQQKNFRRQKRRLFKAAIGCALIVMGTAYYFSDAALVKTVSVQGNVSLSRSDVLELAGITAHSRWLMVFTPQVKNALQQYPLIASASVRHERGNKIVIEIEEREPVGYRYIEEPEILLKDGSIVKMDERMVGLIARIPLIVGFQSAEQSADLAMAFRNVSAGMISLISEIQQFEVSYDPNMIRLIMHDGNQFFSSYYSMDVLNEYNSIVSNLNKAQSCIYVDEMSKSAYTQLCPGEVDPNAPAEGDSDENSDTNGAENE